MTHHLLDHCLVLQGTRPYPSQIPHAKFGRCAAKIIQVHLA
jgi:hypothetical protein